MEQEILKEVVDVIACYYNFNPVNEEEIIIGRLPVLRINGSVNLPHEIKIDGVIYRPVVE